MPIEPTDRLDEKNRPSRIDAAIQAPPTLGGPISRSEPSGGVLSGPSGGVTVNPSGNPSASKDMTAALDMATKRAKASGMEGVFAGVASPQAAAIGPASGMTVNPGNGVDFSGHMTSGQRSVAADAYRDGVDKATGTGPGVTLTKNPGGAVDFSTMDKRFDAYKKDDGILAMRNTREDLLGSGIRMSKDGNGGIVISNDGNRNNPLLSAGGSSINMQEGNASLARANKARGEMINSMVAAQGGNGVAILGGGGPTEEEKINAERTQRWALDDIKSSIRSAGSRSERAVLAQTMGAMLSNQTQQRGQDMNYAATMAQQGVAARGQDLNAQSDANRNAVAVRGQDISSNNDAVRLGLDRSRLEMAGLEQSRANEKWGIERGILQGQAADSEAIRTARSELTEAISSGDRERIAGAKEKAVAAGIKFDKPNNEFTVVTDSMGLNVTRTNKDTGAIDIINPKTGQTTSIPAPGSAAQASPKVAPAAAIEYLSKNPKQAAAFKAKYGYLPEGY